MNQDVKTEQLAKETLQSCQEYIYKLADATVKIAEQIQSGNEGEGMRMIPPVLDGMQWLFEAMQGLQQHGYLLEIDWRATVDKFKELEAALTVRDYVLIADIFEYEIEPALKEWLEKIEQSLDV
ncbi:hypothetical protein M1N64_04175 [Peptococcaceae bacterium]|nr:hypothetical protein [Peptococcaceae bacterium]